MAYSNKTGLPSVSDILSPYEDTRWFKTEHSDRGNFVHSWVAADLQGLFAPPVPEAYSGYIESYLAFKPHIKAVYVVERRLTSAKGFCGQVDLVCLLDDIYHNIVALLDWKTGKAAMKIWHARLGGYVHLLKESGILVGGACTVRLRERPTPATGEVFPLVDLYYAKELKELEIDFLSALRVYNNCLHDGKIYASYEKIEEDF
jgi:hypothetical protein